MWLTNGDLPLDKYYKKSFKPQSIIYGFFMRDAHFFLSDTLGMTV